MKNLTIPLRYRRLAGENTGGTPVPQVFQRAVSRLDPPARIEIRELLKELRRMGKTIIISSHILPELADLCTTVGIIEQGNGPIKDIIARAKMGTKVLIAVTDQQDLAAMLLKKPAA